VRNQRDGRRLKACRGRLAARHLAEQHAALGLRGFGGLDQGNGDLVRGRAGILDDGLRDVFDETAFLFERATLLQINDDFRH